MYQGLPFDKDDEEYIKLVAYSKKLCREYSELISYPTKDFTENQLKEFEKKEKRLLKQTFL